MDIISSAWLAISIFEINVGQEIKGEETISLMMTFGRAVGENDNHPCIIRKLEAWSVAVFCTVLIVWLIGNSKCDQFFNWQLNVTCKFLLFKLAVRMPDERSF